jgi:hypothetical protein
VVGLTELAQAAAAPEPRAAEVRAWHAPPAYRFPTAAASHPDIWQARHDANDAN